MYHDFFGLEESAFSIAVNPRYLFMSDQHREALAHLIYGIQNGGFVMLTGEVGTGKTTLVRCLLEQLPDNTDIAIILNPMASAPELLSTICDELGVSYISDELSVKNLTDALNHFLLDNHRKGRKTVVLIDEAQLLDVPVLEQIRLLTNLETNTQKLLQIMLVGQPELKELLARPDLRQLSQRITARFHLDALTLNETAAYIYHRLKVAGIPDHVRPFNDRLIQDIHRFSGGIPRLINVLCERCLLGAYAKNQLHVSKAILVDAEKEVAGSLRQASQRYALGGWEVKIPAKHVVFAAFTALIVIGVWLFVPDSSDSVPNVVIKAGSPEIIASGKLNDVLVSASSAAAVTQPAQDVLSTVTTRTAQNAQRSLLTYLGMNVSDAANPCTTLTNRDYECAKTRLTSWDEIKSVNRPGVITLSTPDKKWVYAVLIALSENYALLHLDGRDQVVRWSELVERWTGDYLYVWSRPAGFETALQQGDRGDVVTWVAEQFAKLDNQTTPLTRQFFTDRLQKRVALFQSTQGLIPDGIFNEATLRKLNEVVGIDKGLSTLDESKVDDSELSSMAATKGSK